MTRIVAILALLAACFAAQPGAAQSPTQLCIPTLNGGCQVVGTASPLPVGTCTQSAAVNVTSGSTTQLVALTAGQSIRVCGAVLTGSAAATVATFAYGTGTNCGTGTTSLTGGMLIDENGSLAIGGAGQLLATPASNALCLTAATGNVTGFISYAKY